MADKNELLSHESDGIKEYDNDLPRWWVVLFWITLIYGGIYAVWFHSPSTPTPVAALNADMQALEQQRSARASAQAATAPAVTDESILAFVSSAAAMQKGAEIYALRCAACHGPQGQGLIGPNLTDTAWIHGGKPTQIRHTIAEGVTAKGMLAWKNLMTAEEMSISAAYVVSLKGTNPPNPKAPEGTVE